MSDAFTGGANVGVIANRPPVAQATGTWYFATDDTTGGIHGTMYYSDGTSWNAQLGGGAGAVTSVANKTGAVTLVEGDITSLTSDLALKANIASPTFTGTTSAPEYSVSGLTGATTATRYVGGTPQGPPASGTFLVGDFVLDVTGAAWICTSGGTPGTWAILGSEYQAGSASYAISTLGFKASNGDPAFVSPSPPGYTSGTLYLARIVCPQAFTLATVSVINSGGQNTPTANVASVNTGAANIVNGSGNITPNPNTSNFTLTTGSVSLYASTGTVTIGTHQMAFSAWSGTSMTVLAGSYLAGATIAVNQAISQTNNVVVVYNSSGNPIAVSADLAGATLNTSGFKQVPVEQGNSIAAGAVVYAGFFGLATTPAKLVTFGQTVGASNVAVGGQLSAANLRWSTNGTGLVTPTGTITVGSNSNNNNNCSWFGLS